MTDYLQKARDLLERHPMIPLDDSRWEFDEVEFIWRIACGLAGTTRGIKAPMYHDYIPEIADWQTREIVAWVLMHDIDEVVHDLPRIGTMELLGYAWDGYYWPGLFNAFTRNARNVVVSFEYEIDFTLFKDALSKYDEKLAELVIETGSTNIKLLRKMIDEGVDVQLAKEVVL